MISYRNAIEDDLSMIIHVFQESVRNTCSEDYSPKEIEAWLSSAKDKETWKKRIFSQFFLIAENQNNIIAFASLEASSYIDLFYLSSAHQKKGVAQELFQKLLDEAKQKDSKKLYSDVSITALPFFKRQGFHVIRKNEKIRLNEILVNYRMELEIGNKFK